MICCLMSNITAMWSAIGVPSVYVECIGPQRSSVHLYMLDLWHGPSSELPTALKLQILACSFYHPLCSFIMKQPI
jgi:hypothetical protein